MTITEIENHIDYIFNNNEDHRAAIVRRIEAYVGARRNLLNALAEAEDAVQRLRHGAQANVACFLSTDPRDLSVIAEKTTKYEVTQQAFVDLMRDLGYAREDVERILQAVA